MDDNFGFDWEAIFGSPLDTTLFEAGLPIESANLDDYVVTETGLIRDSAGNTGTFKSGQWVPYEGGDVATFLGRDGLNVSRLLTNVKSLLNTPAAMAGLGALAGTLDRQRPSGGGTTMAYQGPAELKRKIVQGPYGPVAEYEGVGGGSPDYTRFAAPTVTSPAPPPSAPDYEELLNLVRSLAPKTAAPATPVAAPVAAPVASTPGTKPRSDMGFTRDPNAMGASVMTPWYNKKTGQTYTAPDTAWQPPSADWVQGQFDASGSVNPAAEDDVVSLTGPIGYKAGDPQATFGNRVYGPRYEAELKDEDLRNALAVSGAKAVADASTAGGVYQRGDLTPVYAPNFSDPESVAQFEQYYPHAKQYGTSFFTPDVLEVDPGFAAYHNQSALASIENAAEEARKRGEDPVAARERIRAEQDALHNRLSSGKGLLAGASGAGGSSIDPTFLSSLGVDPYAGLDTSFRSALDLKPYESYTAPGETNPWGQYKEVLPALDVASGRLSYEQGQAIKQGYEANKNLQSYTQQTNIRDQMVKNLQNELANLKYDPVNLESYNRTREDLIGRIRSMGGETEQFKQNLAQSQDAMKPYADTLSGIKDWSGLSSNLIKGGLGLAQGGPVRMEDGGFVMTKRAVDGAGGPRGIQQLVPGARMIKGPGHGTSDSIPAYIQGRNGRTPARLSNGEAYVPPGRDTDKLYALMKSLERNA